MTAADTAPPKTGFDTVKSDHRGSDGEGKREEQQNTDYGCELGCHLCDSDTRRSDISLGSLMVVKVMDRDVAGGD